MVYLALFPCLLGGIGIEDLGPEPTSPTIPLRGSIIVRQEGQQKHVSRKSISRGLQVYKQYRLCGLESINTVDDINPALP